MSELHLGELAALATAVLWTLSSLIWTATGKQIGALAVSFIRVLLVCVLLMVYGQAVRGQWLPIDLPLKTWLLLGLSGFFWFFLSDLSLFKAFLLIGPRLALLILSLSPPMAAALSWICIGDKLVLWRWMAMGVTLAGVGWVILEQPNGQDHPHTRRDRLRGVLLAMFAAAAQAVAIVLTKKGVGECDPMAATTISMFGALIGYLALVTLMGRWPPMLAAVGRRKAMAMLLCGVVIGPFVGVACNMIALRYAPAGVVATLIATMPVLILPFSIALHREKATLRAIAGAVVAVAGVAMLML
jgi:drug/metabolite transporter (DMT)-like permease